MSVQHYPGDFRIGVLNRPFSHVEDSGTSDVQPKMMILVLLSGWQKFVLGGQHFELDARVVPDAVLLRVLRPSPLTYLQNRGQPVVKVSLAMPVDWLAGVPGGIQGVFKNIPDDDIGMKLALDAGMIATVQAIVAATAPLERMALGMQLLDTLSGNVMAACPTSTDADDAMIARVRRLISAAPQGQHMNAMDLANACGIGLRRLERVVKANENTSLGALIRDERQMAAVRALRAGMSVTQAAAIAGYTRAENFAAAIRKRYGCAPTALRETVDPAVEINR